MTKYKKLLDKFSNERAFLLQEALNRGNKDVHDSMSACFKFCDELSSIIERESEIAVTPQHISMLNILLVLLYCATDPASMREMIEHITKYFDQRDFAVPGQVH